MRHKNKRVILKFLYATIAVGSLAASLLSAPGCTSKSGSGTEKDKETGQRSPVPVVRQPNPDPRIDLNCVYSRLQKPSESFHYVYKKDSSDGFKVDQEADLTPQTVDGFRLQPDGSQQPLHAVSSDPSGWQAALAGLTGNSGRSGTVSTFNNTSAMQRESDGGQVNGYQTIHY